MEISEKWLREWVDPPVDSETLASQLTMAGLEVGGIRGAAPAIGDVVVAEVVETMSRREARPLLLSDTGWSYGG